MIQVRFIYVYIEGNRTIPRWSFLIIHGGTKEFFGTLNSFFRSFISFFRTFISALREGFSFARWRFPISSVEIKLPIAHSDYSC